MRKSRNSIEIARHAERVRRYKRKLKIRAKTREGVKRIQGVMEDYESKRRAMQNVGSFGDVSGRIGSGAASGVMYDVGSAGPRGSESSFLNWLYDPHR